MFDSERFANDLLQISSEEEFENLSMELFKYQSKNNHVYSKYLDLLGINDSSVTKLDHIPFLPIQFYKSQPIRTGDWEADKVFESSGTTGQIRSRHYVRSLDWYNRVSARIFEKCYGKPDQYDILALLPSYLERDGSSLVYMVDYFIQLSNSKSSQFVLNEYEKVLNTIELSRKQGRSVILFGVTFALLDMAERYQTDFSNVIVIETGGMKGRREELTRSQVHQKLRESFRGVSIHSEYGMTELLSQAYALKGGIFKCPAWMNVRLRDITDPFSYVPEGATGGVNIIDLANFDTCSFIETEDLGRMKDKNTFEILGRFDNSEIRGCNILVS